MNIIIVLETQFGNGGFGLSERFCLVPASLDNWGCTIVCVAHDEL